jgi:hypothetical protein
MTEKTEAVQKKSPEQKLKEKFELHQNAGAQAKKLEQEIMQAREISHNSHQQMIGIIEVMEWDDEKIKSILGDGVTLVKGGGI